MKEAILVIAYNRLDYFRKTLESISLNSESKQLPIYLSIDYPQRDIDTRDEHVQLFKENFPFGKVLYRQENRGGCVHTIDARRQIFDHLKYNLCYYFEDDTVVAPYYIKTLKNIYDFVGGEDIFIIQAWRKCLLTYKEKVDKLNDLQMNKNVHQWAYLMPRSGWDIIKETLYEYEEKFLNNIHVKDRNHKAIRDWLRDKFRIAISDTSVTSQDGISKTAAKMLGLKRINTFVNHALPIGAIGEHMNEQKWENSGYNNMKLDLFSLEYKWKILI